MPCKTQLLIVLGFQASYGTIKEIEVLRHLNLRKEKRHGVHYAIGKGDY